MTINFQTAKRIYDGGRKYKPLGVKFTKNIWLSYDKDADCFVFSYVWSKYYEDANGKQVKAGAGDRDKYTMRSFAFMYQDRTHLIHPDPNSSISLITRNFFEEYFLCIYRRDPSVKFHGFEWTFFEPGAAIWKRNHGENYGTVFKSGNGVIISNNGAVASDSEPLVRVFNKDAQKALNAHIKAIRRMISLRAKLGGFSSLNWGEINSNLQAKFGQRGMYAARSSVLVNKAIMEVDGEDFMTMVPVLWMAMCREAGYHRNVEDHNSRDLLTVINRLIDANREGLRKQNGTVEYVSNESLSQPL